MDELQKVVRGVVGRLGPAVMAAVVSFAVSLAAAQTGKARPLSPSPGGGAAEHSSKGDEVTERGAGKSPLSVELPGKMPPRYTLDYPVMDRCAPPLYSAFEDAASSLTVVRGRRYRFQPNGGYGLLIVDKVNGQHLLHTGADLGWHRPGAPVFAIGAGIVRVSEGPASPPSAKPAGSRPTPKEADPGERKEKAGGASMPWGNVIVLEHRLPSGEFVTSLYGHLDKNRLVEVGDVVRPGQQIGAIGRKSPHINGGYDPHLHFGILTGRFAEPGRLLYRLRRGAERLDVRLTAVTEEVAEVDWPPTPGERVTVEVGGERFTLEAVDGRSTMPARALWSIQSDEFPLVGYALSLRPFRDPLAFLKTQNADGRLLPPIR